MSTARRRPLLPLLVPLLLHLTLPGTGAAEIQPARDAPRPLSPAESAARMRLPAGFQIDLVASEPLVEEPSCIAWDERGRLFVSELHGYNIEGHLDTVELNQTGVLDTTVRRIRWELEGGPIAEEAAKRQHGVLKLLHDRDGDGLMDDATIWAEDLPPCYGIIPARGGILVTCAPDIVFFADRDGDDHPEVREILYTGFQLRVLERGINNPIWGLDDWIYVGSGGDGGTITGPRLESPVHLGNTDFRIRADGTAIEPVTGRVGTFGLTMNEMGDRFPSSGGRPAIFALPLPYHYLTRNPHVATPDTNHTAAHYDRGYRISDPHPWRVRRAQDPAWVEFYGSHETTSIYFSGGCSTTFYGDALFPSIYRGNLFYCEPSLNIIHHCVLRREGAGYLATRAPGEETQEFLASTDPWFRPVNLRTGPRGALHIVDMYREIIEDYSAIPRFLQQQYGLDHGKHHGRIWRLRPDGKAAKTSPLSLAKMTGLELATLLDSPQAWQRQTAQRLLIERDARDATDPIAALIHSRETSPPGVLHALHTLRALKTLTPGDVATSLAHPHHGVRVHALRLSETWLGSAEDLQSRILSMTEDTDPAVRLQLAMTLGQWDDPRVVPALIELASTAGEVRWMDAAILSSANTRHGGTLFQGLLASAAAETLARSLIEPLAKTVTARETGVLTEVLRPLPLLSPELQAACLEGVIAGLDLTRARHEPDPETVDRLATLCEGASSRVRRLTAHLASALRQADHPGLARLFTEEAGRAEDRSRPVEDRQEALAILAHAPFDNLSRVTDGLLDPREPPSLQMAAMKALETCSDPRASEALLRPWKSATPETRKAILTALLAVEARHPDLIQAIEDGLILARNLGEIEMEKLFASRVESVAERARKLLSSPREPERDRAEREERFARYREALSQPADLTRGEAVFKATCSLCHASKGAAQAIGPSLASAAAQPPETLLADILDPGSKIDPEYTLYVVTTEQGRSHAGVLASESPTSLTLVQADGSSAVILRRDLAEMTASGHSLMPDNLHTVVSPADMTSLIAFLRRGPASDVEPAPAPPSARDVSTSEAKDL